MQPKQLKAYWAKQKKGHHSNKIEMGKCRGCGKNAIYSWSTAGYCPRCMRGKEMDWSEVKHNR